MEQLTFDHLWDCEKCQKKDDEINKLFHQLDSLSKQYNELYEQTKEDMDRPSYQLAQLYLKLLSHEYKDDLIPCVYCDGTGERNVFREDTYGCTRCSYEKCPNCSGKGSVVRLTILDQDVFELQKLMDPVYKRANELRKNIREKYNLNYFWNE